MAHVHLVGIGGAGLSAIATVLLQQGYTVSGSDMQDSPALDRLRQQGARVTIGHAAANIERPDVVVISSAIPATNLEVVEARQKGISVLKRPAWLGQMMAGRRGLAVAGTHGKTTTTAMLALILQQAGRSPTYIVGGYVPQLRSNAAAGESDLFVIEADEYDHTFLSLQPEIAVITNIEWDHPDIYHSEAALHQAFDDFARLVPAHGWLIVCGDDPGVRELLARFPTAVTYGLTEQNAWRAVDLVPAQAGAFRFHIQQRGRRLTERPLALAVPGRYNVRNALAAFVAATAIGVEPRQAAQILSTFHGAERRFEIKGEVNGVTIIDDYGHHPTAIRTTLAAARVRFGVRPIWAVLQPHTFSRTRLLLNEFAAAFDEADHVILLDIYPSRERDDGSVHSRNILARMRHPDARYLGRIADAVAYLRAHLAPGDVLITYSAGDGNQVGQELLREADPAQ